MIITIIMLVSGVKFSTHDLPFLMIIAIITQCFNRMLLISYKSHTQTHTHTTQLIL